MQLILLQQKLNRTYNYSQDLEKFTVDKSTDAQSRTSEWYSQLQVYIKLYKSMLICITNY